MKINPLNHFERNIKPLSTGAETSNEKASNSF